MANQLDISNVLYVNNNPLKVAETYSLLTSDILIYEVDNPLYPGINSATQYYNNTSNQLAYITYFSTKTVNSLLAAANIGVASLVKVPVKSINKIPFAKDIDFLFPASGIQLREISTNTTEIYFKGSYYLTDTPIASIIAQANTGGGGGGGTNPTNLFIPYNDAGTFEDSYLKNDTTVGAETLSAIFNGSELGLKLEFWDNFYAFGDFTWYNNGTSFIVDDAAQVVKTFYQGNDIGLKLDFGTRNYILGEILSGSVSGIEIEGGINTYVGNDYLNNNANRNIFAVLGQGSGTIYTAYREFTKTGIHLENDKSTGLYAYKFGYDLDLTAPNNLKPFWLLVKGDDNSGESVIKTQYNSNDIGLKLDFGNNDYQIGDGLGYLQIDYQFPLKPRIRTFADGKNMGIFVDSNAEEVFLGLIQSASNDNPTIYFSNQGYIATTCATNIVGWKVDWVNNICDLGDNTGNDRGLFQVNYGTSNSYIKSPNPINLDDYGTGNMIINKPTVITNDDYLIININGNTYYILLYQV